MAVSILESNAARTAELYVPVSRLRARPELVQQLGIGFCREHDVIPLSVERDGVVCATTRPRDQELMQELRRRLGRPISVRAAGRAEIALALAASTGTVTAQDWRRALAVVLQAMRVLPPEQVDMYVLGGEEEPYLGAALVDARVLTEEERLEAVGLAFHLPSLDLRHHPVRAGLEALLPADVIAELRVLPVWTVRDELFFAINRPPSVEVMERLRFLLGLPLRPLLVSHEELTRRLGGLPADDAGAAVDLRGALRYYRLATPAQMQAAGDIARATREPFERVIQRLAGITDEQIRQATARFGGAGAEAYAGLAEVDRGVAGRLPRALARRLRCAVIEMDDDDARVAMVDPWDQRARRGLAAFLRRRIRPIAVTQRDLEEILELAPESDARDVLAVGDPERLVALLAEAGFVDEAGAAAVDVDLSRLDTADLPRIWELVENGSRSEAVALEAALPRVHQLLLRPEPVAARMRPVGPDAPPLLPLLCEDDVLTVAFASPDRVEAARQLAGAHQCVVRLVVAREDDIDAARIDLATLDFAAVPAAYEGLARVLEQRLDIPRVRVLGLIRRMQETAEPVDVAARQIELLSGTELRDALGAYMHVDPLELARRDRLDTTEEGGVSVTRRVLADPVDHAAARRLELADARRLGAVPVHDEGEHLVVAMADPLDERTRTEVGRLLGVPIVVRPATRSDIVEAAQRAHGYQVVGDLLLESDRISRADLDRALELSERAGVRLGEALLSLDIISEEQLGEALAAQQGMPFVAIRGLDLDPEIAELLPEHFVRAQEIVPLSVDDDGIVTLAIADPGNRSGIEEARALLDRPVNIVGTTRSDVRDALERLYHEQYLEHSAGDLMRRAPEDSAYKVLSRGQKVFLIGLVAALAALLLLFPIVTLTVLLALATGFYLTFSSYKFYLIYRALSHTLEVPVTDQQVDALDDRTLPVYTILVPLYRESEVLPALVKGLSRLDYPIEKLDVKLLLEEDDPETIQVARNSNLPSTFDITIVPDGQPKGKPKACNYGLLHARGEYVVIFDAEDIPEPDQLKKVLVAFSIAAENVVCIQGKLNYYNRTQNALTKWFTTEYSTWFDLFLPGLDASGAPIPLGGTSNHFRTEALRAVGGWDPFNVTEDADLGLRIFKLGGATAVVDSTTYEEANSVLDNWIRQRSRWVKGYIQTYLVHMRHPMLLWQQLGPSGFLSFQLVIGGTFFGFLLNPVLWGLTGVWFLTHWGVIQQLFPAPIFYMGAISLYAGNFAFAYMNVAGCLRRRYYSLVKWALLSPVYWVLMSIAAWKGFLQLFYRPFYWEKTIHGLSNVSGIEAAGLGD